MNATPRHPTDHASEENERLALTGLLPPPPVPGLTPDRELLLKQALLAEAARTEPSARPARRAARPRRRLLRVLAPAVVCALAVGGVVVVNLPDTPRRGPAGVVAAAPPVRPKRHASSTASHSPPPPSSGRRSAPTSSCTSRARSPTPRRAPGEAP